MGKASVGAELEWASYDTFYKCMRSELEYLGGSIYIGIEFSRLSAPWGT